MGEYGSQRDESLVTTRVIFNKTDQGWNIVTTPLEIEMKRNGKAVENPVFQILRNNPVTYELNKKGKIKNVSGYGDISERILKSFDNELGPKLSKLFDKDAMKKKAIAEWNLRTGDYVGKEVKNGEQWNKKEDFILPDGSSFKYDVKINFFLNEKYKDKDCVKILMIYSGKEPLKEKKYNAVIKGEAQVLVDPFTMMIYFQKVERDILMDVNIKENKRIPVRITEKRIYSYQYK